jgi:hypothetical protein
LQANNELICNILYSLLVSLRSLVCRKFLVVQNMAPPGDDLPTLRQLLTIAKVTLSDHVENEVVTKLHLESSTADLRRSPSGLLAKLCFGILNTNL